MSYKVTTQTDLPEDKIVNVSIKDKQPWYMHFRAYGTFNPKQPESVEALEYICQFSKCELAFLREVYGQIDPDRRLVLRLGVYSPAKQAKFKKAIQLWIKKGLMVRIKKQHYMVNPWFLIPPKELQLETMNRWRELNASQAHS